MEGEKNEPLPWLLGQSAHNNNNNNNNMDYNNTVWACEYSRHLDDDVYPSNGHGKLTGTNQTTLV